MREWMKHNLQLLIEVSNMARVNTMFGALTLVLPVAANAAGSGGYTQEQAQAGAQVFSATCSVCHGSKLQGGAAPALTSAAFGQTLKTTYPTTSKLFDVIATLMPVNNPGSLSKTQDTDVLAFILASNGYPAGTAPLDPARLDDLALLPFPDQGTKKADANLEIQNIGSANRWVVGALPDKASVTISDAMRASVDSRPADWLLHGRDYSNQRFSPLKDIDAGNVSSLTAVALVQTGITSSFETTPIVVNGVMYATTPTVDETMAPQIYKNMIIVGSAGGEWPIRGFVAAFDASTGKEIWRWQSTDPKSYAGDAWQRGGGMVWTTPAIDTKRDLIIFSTGNPNPDLYGPSRQGDNLYTDSIVALHASTGKLAWYYQEVPHDVWDYDAVSNVVLFDTTDHGRTVPAAGEAGKTGWFYIVNRDTGKLIRRSEPFVDQSKNMFAQPTKEGVQMLPGANGGAEWSPPAFSPITHDAYILGMNQLMTFTTGDDPGFQPGAIRLGSSFTNVAKDSLQNGVFTAINVDTGKVAWQYQAKQPLIGGALATAGNLVFMGEGDGYFDAFDATSGAKLWKFNLGAGVNAPPITYTVNGVQYIAVASGGNFQMGFPYGDSIAIFKLGK
jgi:outer membrane protein assembly factor BamB/mono/diheme cytochrome c family protein